MKKFFIIALAVVLFTACNNTTTREYRAADNSVVAICQYSGDDSLHAVWQFLGPDGKPLFKDCDSLLVVDRGLEGHPMTVCFYFKDRQEWIQYYSTMQLRSQGAFVNGQREGRWVFFFPNGLTQTECTFIGGKENGPYKVFRENGIPYYIGQYDNGQRTGTWEIYDADGTLVTTQEY